MPSPTQLFFDELADLSFVDEVYKKRFIEELHDHIEDAIHDADVRGVDDATAEKAAVQKLGSPKKLQKNFNRMMKPQRVRTVFLLILSWIGTYCLLSIAAIPFYGVAHTMLAVFQRSLGLDYTAEALLLPNLASTTVLTVVATLVLIILQTALFQSVLLELLAVRMKQVKFWLIYIGVALLPWLCIVGVFALATIGETQMAPSFWIEQNMGFGFLFAFVTLCFSLAAINTILKLNGRSLWWLALERMLGERSRPVKEFFTRHQWFSMNNAVGVLSLLYLVFWCVVGLNPEFAQWLMSGEGMYTPGGEPKIAWLLFIMPFMVINVMQTIITSLLFTSLNPVMGMWVAGLFYSGIVLLCVAIIGLRLRRPKKELKVDNSVWVPMWIGLLAIMILMGALPTNELNQDIQVTEWQRPQVNLTTAMDKKIFGPFYRLFDDSSLFSSIPSTDILVDFRNEQFVIDSVMGSAFLMNATDANSLYMTDRQSTAVVGRALEQLNEPIPHTLDARVICGEKPLNKKADFQMDSGQAYECSRIVVDGVEIVKSNYPLLLTDIAINDGGTYALVVIHEDSRKQLYGVSLK